MFGMVAVDRPPAGRSASCVTAGPPPGPGCSGWTTPSSTSSSRRANRFAYTMVDPGGAGKLVEHVRGANALLPPPGQGPGPPASAAPPGSSPARPATAAATATMDPVGAGKGRGAGAAAAVPGAVSGRLPAPPGACYGKGGHAEHPARVDPQPRSTLKYVLDRKLLPYGALNLTSREEAETEVAPGGEGDGREGDHRGDAGPPTSSPSPRAARASGTR